jgi:hypothetical protein
MLLMNITNNNRCIFKFASSLLASVKITDKTSLYLVTRSESFLNILAKLKEISNYYFIYLLSVAQGFKF